MPTYNNGESGSSVRTKINSAITTVDGLGSGDNLLMTAAERSKLTGIENNATADQTGAEIKTAYESEADTNAFTDADHSKLDGIATGATANSGALADLDTVDTAQIDNDAVTIAKISATGTASSSTFLRGDGQWAAPAGGGGGDLLAANNLSDLDNLVTSRANLGVEIGADVQAYSATLAATTASYTTAEETKLSGIATSATANPNAIDNVVEDTTPQLGGDLDVNGNSIVSTSNGDITLAPNGTGNVVIGNFTIDADATVGAGQDNYVLTYDHSSGTWGAEASAGGGSGDLWSDAVDADIVPDADGTRDLGSSSNRFANLHVDSIDLDGTTLSGANLADPGFDAVVSWDDSAGDIIFMSWGTGLSTSGTTINAEVSLTNTATLTNKTLTAPIIDVGVTTDATTARTLALTDASDVVLMSSGSANTVTIPTNASVAFATGTMITIVSTGAGATTIAGDTGVTLQGNGGSVSAGSCDIQTQYGAAALIKVASDTWIVSGDIDTVA